MTPVARKLEQLVKIIKKGARAAELLCDDLESDNELDITEYAELLLRDSQDEFRCLRNALEDIEELVSLHLEELEDAEEADLPAAPAAIPKPAPKPKPSPVPAPHADMKKPRAPAKCMKKQTARR